MEHNPFDNQPDSANQPPEYGPSAGERTAAEQLEHIALLSGYAKELGFVDVAEEVKENTAEWSKRNLTHIATLEKNTILRKTAYLGYMIELAGIHYKNHDSDNYFQTMERAYNQANGLQGQEFEDIKNKIDEIA
jgi:hypothetical protein